MAESKKPKDTDFIQQRLKAYQPVHTIEATIGTLLGCSLLFLVFGVVLYSQASSVVETRVPYHECDNSTCTVSLVIEGKMKKPIFVYYELHNFYQNHRLFAKSRSYPQLRGEDVAAADLESTCTENTYGDSLYEREYINGEHIADNAIANPCGLFARAMFNDTFKLTDPDSRTIEIDETEISWPSDTKYLFERNEHYKDTQWWDVDDEHFVVWMRTAVTRGFRKLWGRVVNTVDKDGNDNGALAPGKYSVEIENNYNVSAWKGEKYIVLTNANSLGGQNYSLGMIFVFTSLMCCFSSMFFCGRAMISKKGSLTADELSW